METNDSDSDDQDGSYCLVCHSTTSFSNTPTSKQYFQHPLNPEPFLKDLQTYFLLRHILGISSEQLQGYLRHCPYPGEWVKVCSLCTENYVDRCTRTFLELQEVRRKYRVARELIFEVVKKSVENDPETVEPFTLDICREVRLFVAQNSKELLEDSITNFVASDTKGHGGTSRNRKRNLISAAKNENVLGGANNYLELCDTHDDSRDDFENVDEPYVRVTRRVFSTPNQNKRNNRKIKRTTKPLETSKFTDDQSDANLNGYACDLCPKTFSNSDNLRKHKKECHSETFHYCSEEGCDYKSRRSYDVKNHIKRHHGSVSDIIDLTCPLCGKVFSKKSHLNYHMIHSREHNTNPNIACPLCDKKFIDVMGLRSHQAVVHNAEKFQLHVCAFENCRKGVYRKCHLIEHETSHKGLKCEVCEKSFKTLKHLKAHQELHKIASSSSFSCVQCSMRFIKRTDLLEHKKLKHGPAKMNTEVPANIESLAAIKAEPEVDCTNEDNATSSSPAFIDDDRANSVNSGDENLHDNDWKAGDSDKNSDNDMQTRKKKYNRKVTGTRARKVKVKEPFLVGRKIGRARKHIKPDESLGYPCEHEGCAEVMKTRRHYKLHLKSVHGISQIPMEYPCEQEGCSEVMKTLARYNLHLKSVHGTSQEPEVYCCDVCGQNFEKRLNFSLHMTRVHGITAKQREPGKYGKDEGPFKCSQCDMTFVNKFGVTRHVRIKHLREYKFYCELCGKGMVNQSELKYHRVQYHYICAIDGCGITCEGQNEIWTHHRDVHNTEVGIFSCNECGKLFIGNKKLKVHLELHEFKRRKQEQSAEKGARVVVGQYECELCEKRFPVRDYLSRHMSYDHRGKPKQKKKEKTVVKKDTEDAWTLNAVKQDT